MGNFTSMPLVSVLNFSSFLYCCRIVLHFNLSDMLSEDLIVTGNRQCSFCCIIGGDVSICCLLAYYLLFSYLNCSSYSCCHFVNCLLKFLLTGSTGISFVPHVLNVTAGEVKYFLSNILIYFLENRFPLYSFIVSNQSWSIKLNCYISLCWLCSLATLYP